MAERETLKGWKARHRGAIALALALLASWLAPPGAPAAEKAIWGQPELPGGGSPFPVYRRLGVDTLQIQLRFSRVASTRPANATDPDDPAYRWPELLDAQVREAVRYDINPALLVTSSPAWANGGRPANHAPSPRAFADFLTAASRRYPAVRRWMIWGEPNRGDNFQPNAEDSPVGPRAYARILDNAYAALKKVSRRNIVIGGMSWTGGEVTPALWLRYLRLPNGRPPRLDWYGHNPFPFRFPDLSEPPLAGGFRDISDLDTMEKELRRTYARKCTRDERRRGITRCGRRPRLWLSEFTVQSDHGSRSFALAVSRADQARWLRAAYRIADQLPSVAGLGWFSLLDEPEGPLNGHWGLLTDLGKMKPAGNAYLRAPAVRFRPRVATAARPARAVVARRGLVVSVRPRAAGTVRVTLQRAGGSDRLVRSRAARPGRTIRLRFRPARPRSGAFALTVQASRGETVRRMITVR
jgi:hypothetical protein